MVKYNNEETKKLESLAILGEKPASEKEEKFLREVCEYVFQNLEEPGISMSFMYGGTKNCVNLLMMHGGKYRFPRFLARHIENCSKPIYENRPDGNGSTTAVEVARTPRFQMRQVYSKG